MRDNAHALADRRGKTDAPDNLLAQVVARLRRLLDDDGGENGIRTIAGGTDLMDPKGDSVAYGEVYGSAAAGDVIFADGFETPVAH